MPTANLAISTFGDLEYLKDLLLVLTQKDLTLRYKRSWLGYVWSVANPLAFACVYYVAFGIVMGVNIPHYVPFLVAGLFPWHWLAHSLNAAPHVFLSNATLMKRMLFPRQLLVGAMVFTNGLHFVFAIPVVGGLMLLDGLRPSWSWIAGIPLLLTVQFLMIYGVALGVASLNPFFRDLDHVTSVAVSFLFFLTPIAYSSSMIPAQYQSLMAMNPISPLMLSWQELFLSGVIHWPLVAASYGWALVCVGLGRLIYRNLSPKFAEVL